MNMIYKTLIFIIIFALAVPSVFAKEQKVYDLILNYDKGTVAKQSLTVAIGVFSKETDQPERGYRLELRSFDNRILYSQNFLFDLVANFLAPPGTFDEEGRQISIPEQEIAIFDEAEKELIFPFFSNGKQIEIYDPENKKILTISVEHFAEITPTVSQKEEPKPESSLDTGSLLWSGGIGLALTIALGLYIYFRHKKSPENSL